MIFELVDHPPIEAQRYRFESVEVKEPSFRIDGVFLPPDDANAKTVFFAECSSKRMMTSTIALLPSRCCICIATVLCIAIGMG
nr:Rpn family recombination-promoting nuclease/putative transposase [Leptolyngbya sp. FACHB-321]